MFSIFRGPRPDVTAAQIGALLVAGVPAIATLLSAFGVADLNQDQRDALSDVLTWGAILAGVLIGGDATLRTARNMVDGRRDAVAMLAAGEPMASRPDEPHDSEADAAEGSSPVSDELEFAESAATVNGHGEIDEPDAALVNP